MTTEEKIDRIHDAVIKIQSDMTAGKIVCDTIHKGVDERIVGLHRAVKGNGQPGLEQKHEALEKEHVALTTRFDRFETKVITWASIAIVVGQILAPIVGDKISKAWRAEGKEISAAATDLNRAAPIKILEDDLYAR